MIVRVENSLVENFNDSGGGLTDEERCWYLVSQFESRRTVGDDDTVQVSTHSFAGVSGPQQPPVYQSQQAKTGQEKHGVVATSHLKISVACSPVKSL